MNQWLIAFLVWWLGTGGLIVLGIRANAALERAKRQGKMEVGLAR